MKLIKRKEIKRDDGTTYMIRWSLISPSWFSIKVHKFLLSDLDCMHDHPWAFISIILRGGYIEQTPSKAADLSHIYNETTESRKMPGAILYRKPNHIHRIKLIPGNYPTYSLVITFKKVRDWTYKGFVNWKNYFSNGTCE